MDRLQNETSAAPGNDLDLKRAHAFEGVDICRHLGTDSNQGLHPEQVIEHRERFGSNALIAREPTPWWRALASQFAEPLVYLLLGAWAISLLLWILEGRENLPFDAIAIAAIVMLNALIGFVQESRAEKAVAALQQLNAGRATVRRHGSEFQVGTNEVVVGDLLILAEGDAVAADARVLIASGIQTLEAPLTGESTSIPKDTAPLGPETAVADRSNMVFSGTSLASGQATAVVVGVGMDTEVGAIAQLLDQTEEQDTPLQDEIARVTRSLGIGVLAIAALVVAVILLVNGVESADDLLDALLIGVSLAVAAVPEGLPAVLSLVLALGVQRMAERNAVVKRLASVEALGSATVICTDKTGTLTKNQMEVRQLAVPSGAALVGEPSTASDVELEALMTTALLASAPSLEVGAFDRFSDPTEQALATMASTYLDDLNDLTRDRRWLAGETFTSDRKRMSVLTYSPNDVGQNRLAIKGAPEIVLDLCSHEVHMHGAVPLTAERRSEWNDRIEMMAGSGQRLLAVAGRSVSGSELESTPVVDLERDLALVGIIGLIDPPRSEATDAVTEAHSAGLRVVMVTGDHPGTASQIAREVGVLRPGDSVLTGIQVDNMTDEEFADAVKSASVFARVTPAHKLRIVTALQDQGEVCAMTGDGVNDAPGLKAADIGISMGLGGTDVAKEAASMVLTDDNFATIVAAVREGRAIFENIQSFLLYLLGSNAGEVLTVLLGVVFAGVLGLTGADGNTVIAPLLAVQILWINLLTDSAPALALGVDPPTGELMKRPPRRAGERILNRSMWRRIFLIGAVMAAVTLLALDLFLPGGFFEGSSTLTEARTAAFTVLVFAQLFNCFNARSLSTSAFSGLFSNLWLWLAVAISALLQVAVVHIGVLNDAFGTTPLNGGAWLITLALASAVLWVSELQKVVSRRRGSASPAAFTF